MEGKGRVLVRIVCQRMTLAIILGAVMGIVHYWSQEFYVKYEKKSVKLLSFSAGISITYLFLELFPQFTAGAAEQGRVLFLSILLGFVLFHIIEKYIFKHSPKGKLMKELALEDSAISFIYHFILGMVLVNLLNQGFVAGFLFFIPIVLYTAVSTLPVDITQSQIGKVIVALSTLLGVVVATYIYPALPVSVYLSLLGFVIGVLSFTTMRHSIPEGKKGEPAFFLLGILLYTLLIFLV